MKIKLVTVLSLFLTNSFFYVNSQDDVKENQFNVSFQYRPRAEYRNGYKTPRMEDDKSFAFINHRARLGFDYQRGGLSANLTFQNISIWGEFPLSNFYESNTNIFEAWTQLKSENGLFAKFGRQILHYNDGRLLSIANWNQSSRSHDALKFGYQTNLHQLDAILAFNQHKEKNGGGTFYNPEGGVQYKTMQVLYYKTNVIKKFTPSLMFINLGFEEGTELESKVANMQTFGTYLIYSPISDLRLTGNAFYQTGKRKGVDQKISAHMLTFKAEYVATKKIKLVAGTDFLSGDDIESDSYNAFDWLYAGNHGLYGFMDFFIDAPYLNNMKLGIWDKFLGVTYEFSPTYSAGVVYHHFSSASEVNDAGTKLSRSFGSEIDLQFDVNVMKDVKFACGYSTFFGTPTMDFVKGGDHKVWQDWAYVMVTVNPRIFSAKW